MGLSRNARAIPAQWPQHRRQEDVVSPQDGAQKIQASIDGQRYVAAGDEGDWANSKDPEETMTAQELITSKGFPFEAHSVHTTDGYVLTLHRIPNRKTPGAPAVLLQHGLLGASTDWLLNPREQSLPYVLADCGMDVWLGNVRGNIHSRGHMTLPVTSSKFWAFSFDEMIQYDLPAMVDHVLQQANQTSLHYVGHSQGTLMGFAGFADLGLASKIKMFFALAPVGPVGHISGPLGTFARLAPLGILSELLQSMRHGEFLPGGQLQKLIGGAMCRAAPWVCENFLFLIAGKDFQHFNVTRLPVYLAHSPCGTSVQNMVHWGQCVRSGRMQMFDYGDEEKNIKKYGAAVPPLYHPERVTVPTALFTAKFDVLSDPTDVAWLETQLNTVVYKKEIADWEHLDFIWGVNAREVVYDDIVRMIQNGSDACRHDIGSQTGPSWRSHGTMWPVPLFVMMAFVLVMFRLATRKYARSGYTPLA